MNRSHILAGNPCLLRPLSFPRGLHSSYLFQAIGRPRIVAQLDLYILLLSLFPLVPLTLFLGTAITAVAMTIPVVIVAGIAMSRAASVLQCRTADVRPRGRGSVASTAVMAAAVLATRYGLYAVLPTRIQFPFVGISIAAPAAVFLIAIPLGVLVYFVFLRQLDREMFEGIWRHLGMVLRPGSVDSTQGGV